MVADPPAAARELVRLAAERGVEVREHTDARHVNTDVRVVACGWRSVELIPELPIRPLVRQLVDPQGGPYRRRGDHRVVAAEDGAVERQRELAPHAKRIDIVGGAGEGADREPLARRPFVELRRP